jgi:tRNA (guanine37-N1)-methyltransferase
MKFEIITIFPEIFKSYFNESLIKKAQDSGVFEVGIHDLRKWTEDKHKKVDDKPFGGGFGMVMKVEPIFKAVKEIKKDKNSKVILFTPRGKKFTQKMATQFSKLDQIIFICGRYEGVDERVAKNIADIELSIGDYVLMGGEIPAMAVIESVSRLIPGVLSKEEMVKERTTKTKGFIEYAQYTRPEVFEVDGKKWKTPKVLLSGDHKKIEEWKTKHGKTIA